jgi:hypothetical protein
VTCIAGRTQLVPILERVVGMEGATVLYVGDDFEESAKRARAVADRLLLQGTRVIILHDGPPPRAFGMIADRTGGALLSFDTAPDQLAGLLQAVAVLAVGNADLLETKQATLPAATLLLEHLDPKRLMIGHGKVEP